MTYIGYALYVGVSLKNYLGVKGVVATDRLNAYFFDELNETDAEIIIQEYVSEGQHMKEFLTAMKDWAPGTVVVMESIFDLGRKYQSIRQAYEEGWDAGIQFRFLDQPFFNTKLYLDNGIDMSVALEQIRLYVKAPQESKASKKAARAYADSRREAQGYPVYDHNKGKSIKSEKRDRAIPLIKKYSIHFDGKMKNKELYTMLGISKTQFHEYVRIINEELEAQKEQENAETQESDTE